MHYNMNVRMSKYLTLIFEVAAEVLLAREPVDQFTGEVSLLAGIERLITSHRLFDHVFDLEFLLLILVIILKFAVTLKHSKIHCLD